MSFVKMHFQAVMYTYYLCLALNEHLCPVIENRHFDEVKNKENGKGNKIKIHTCEM